MCNQIFSSISNYNLQGSWFNFLEKERIFKYNIKFIVYEKEVSKFKHDFSLPLPDNISVRCNDFPFAQFDNPESENIIILTNSSFLAIFSTFKNFSVLVILISIYFYHSINELYFYTHL